MLAKNQRMVQILTHRSTKNFKGSSFNLFSFPEKLIENKSKFKYNSNRKAKSAKKTRLKNKFINIINVIEKITKQKTPDSIIQLIKNTNLENISFNKKEEKEILAMIDNLKTEELAIKLLLIPENYEELKFLKEKLFTKNEIDKIFKSLNYNLVKIKYEKNE